MKLIELLSSGLINVSELERLAGLPRRSVYNAVKKGKLSYSAEVVKVLLEYGIVVTDSVPIDSAADGEYKGLLSGDPKQLPTIVECKITQDDMNEMIDRLKKHNANWGVKNDMPKDWPREDTASHSVEGYEIEEDVAPLYVKNKKKVSVVVKREESEHKPIIEAPPQKNIVPKTAANSIPASEAKKFTQKVSSRIYTDGTRYLTSFMVRVGSSWGRDEVIHSSLKEAKKYVAEKAVGSLK